MRIFGCIGRILSCIFRLPAALPPPKRRNFYRVECFIVFPFRPNHTLLYRNTNKLRATAMARSINFRLLCGSMRFRLIPRSAAHGTALPCERSTGGNAEIFLIDRAEMLPVLEAEAVADLLHSEFPLASGDQILCAVDFDGVDIGGHPYPEQFFEIFAEITRAVSEIGRDGRQIDCTQVLIDIFKDAGRPGRSTACLPTSGYAAQCG